VKMRALMALLLGTSPAMAYPTQADVRALHQELKEVVAQLDALEEAQAGTPDRERVAAHLAIVERHLQSVDAQICAGCTDHSLAKSPYRVIAEACPGRGRVTSSRSLQDYAAGMRKQTHKLRDSIAHMSHERSPYERERLMHLYYRRVLTDSIGRDQRAGARTCHRWHHPQAKQAASRRFVPEQVVPRTKPRRAISRARP
jgi:hypothetical protein